MCRWCAKNSVLATALIFVPLSAAVWAWGIYRGYNLFSLILITFCMLFLSCLGVFSCANTLIAKSVNVLREQCDPYPLLEETEAQMAYKMPKFYKLYLRINHAAALIGFGENSKAFEEMKSIDIEKTAKAWSALKVIYYNNLACIYLYFDEIEKAQEFHNKSFQLLYSLKNNKEKMSVLSAIQGTAAEIALYIKDYVRALEILDNSVKGGLCNEVHKALSYSRIFIAQNRLEEARERLSFVIESGNKLAVVKEAQELLAEICQVRCD